MEVEDCTIVEEISFLSRWKILLDLKKSLGFISLLKDWKGVEMRVTSLKSDSFPLICC